MNEIFEQIKIAAYYDELEKVAAGSAEYLTRLHAIEAGAKGAEAARIRALYASAGMSGKTTSKAPTLSKYYEKMQDARGLALSKAKDEEKALFERMRAAKPTRTAPPKKQKASVANNNTNSSNPMPTPIVVIGNGPKSIGGTKTMSPLLRNSLIGGGAALGVGGVGTGAYFIGKNR